MSKAPPCPVVGGRGWGRRGTLGDMAAVQAACGVVRAGGWRAGGRELGRQRALRAGRRPARRKRCPQVTSGGVLSSSTGAAARHACTSPGRRSAAARARCAHRAGLAGRPSFYRSASVIPASFIS